MSEIYKPAKTPRSNKPTSPEDYPTTPPPPSGDYSYTVEIVMRMQETIGQMKESIDGLKSEAGEQRSKLDTIGKDVHSAKVFYGFGVNHHSYGDRRNRPSGHWIKHLC